MLGGRLRIALSLSVLVLIVGVGTAVASVLSRDRHPGAYQRHVQKYVDGWSSSADPTGPKRDKRWVLAHPEEVLAEGDRACAWLARRPDAPDIDPTGNSMFGVLSRRFARAEHRRNTSVSFYGHSTMTAGAWSYLCDSVRKEKTAPRSHQED
jgi:dienelactone hydrolase